MSLNPLPDLRNLSLAYEVSDSDPGQICPLPVGILFAVLDAAPNLTALELKSTALIELPGLVDHSVPTRPLGLRRLTLVCTRLHPDMADYLATCISNTVEDLLILLVDIIPLPQPSAISKLLGAARQSSRLRSGAIVDITDDELADLAEILAARKDLRVLSEQHSGAQLSLIHRLDVTDLRPRSDLPKLSLKGIGDHLRSGNAPALKRLWLDLSRDDFAVLDDADALQSYCDGAGITMMLKEVRRALFRDD